MAEATSDILTCAICLGRFQDPRLLKCSHTFCKTCLENLVARQFFAKGFQCPVCREWIVIPEGGVNKFQRNFYIRDDSRVRIDCERCDTEATHLCINCGHACCDKCRKAHAKSEFSKRHRIVKFTDLDLADAIKIKQKTYCSLHTAEVVKLVCLDCKKTLLCYICASTEHKHHTTTDISSAASEIRSSLSSELKQCEEFLQKSKSEFIGRESTLSDQKQALENAMKELERKKNEVIASIESKFKSQMKQIRNQQSAFVRIAQRSINSEDMSISNFQERLEKFKKAEALQNDTQIMLQVTKLPERTISRGFPHDSEYIRINKNVSTLSAFLKTIDQANERTQISSNFNALVAERERNSKRWQRNYINCSF